MTGEKVPEQLPGLPDLESLTREVVDSCSCSRQRAIAALQCSDDDIEQAKRHEWTRAKYYQPRSARSSRSQIPAAKDWTGFDAAATSSSLLDPTEADILTPDGSGSDPTSLDRAQRSALPRTPETPDAGYTLVGRGANSDEQSQQLKRYRLHRDSGYADWDFILPILPYPDQPSTAEGAVARPFDLLNLVRGIQHGVPRGDVIGYLADYSGTTVERGINDSVEGFPAIFYVVARNDEALLRAWVARGGDVSAVHTASGVPLLAFAIAQSEIIQQDTTMLLAALLGLDAPSEAIPPEFYTPYHHDLPANGPSLERANNGAACGHAPPVWCSPATSRRLARTANLSQRYYLWRAARLSPTTARSR